MSNTNADLVRDAVVTNQDGMIQEISDLLDSKDARIAVLEQQLKVVQMALARASEGLPV